MLYPEYSKDFLLAAIFCGDVAVDGCHERDHNKQIKKGSAILLSAREEALVSRGANKLAPLVPDITTDIADKVWLDCGCATGGFTQCLLDNGAVQVHAVDVGYNVLDYSLRIDPRVIVHERTNIVQVQEFTPPPSAAVADLSFRTLRKVATHIISLCAEGYLLALCKPQFEYAFMLQHKQPLRKIEDGANYIAVGGDAATSGATANTSTSTTVPSTKTTAETFDGIVEDKNLLRNILYSLCCDLLEEGVMVRRIHPAGIKGKKGNQEYFLEMHRVGQSDKKGECVFSSGQSTDIHTQIPTALKHSTPSIAQAQEHFRVLIIRTI